MKHIRIIVIDLIVVLLDGIYLLLVITCNLLLNTLMETLDTCYLLLLLEVLTGLVYGVLEFSV